VNGDTPVLDTLADITAASIENNSLAPREFMLARLAALIAVDAPPISYFVNDAAIQESGLTAEDIQGVMIAIAPVVGAPRVMSAGGHILRALGIAVAVAESEMADESSETIGR
jgi:alkylhydroperoxidase/carboxymuconolactone decarboxylase family protein YurZ